MSVGDFIRKQRELTKMSLRQAAKAAQISDGYLSQVERGLFKPSADVLRSIADALNISKEALYKQAGILDPDDSPSTGASDVETAIRLDERLTEDQKQALLGVYRGFISGS